MTEQEAVRMVQGAPEGATDFRGSYWDDVDIVTLQSCFDKGFLCWDANETQLIVTPLGKRSCGGFTHERHH